MPDIDGFEACARIKLIEELRDTPVIFLTAQIEDHAKLKAAELGSAAFISKPYEASEMIHAIRAAAAQRPGGTARERTAHA